MCHSRHFLWRERNERFEEDLRRLFGREDDAPDSPDPVVEHELDEQPAAEPPVRVVTAHG